MKRKEKKKEAAFFPENLIRHEKNKN